MGATSPTQNDNNCNSSCLFALHHNVVHEKLKEKFPSFTVVSMFGIFHAEHAGARKVNPKSYLYSVSMCIEQLPQKSVCYR